MKPLRDHDAQRKIECADGEIVKIPFPTIAEIRITTGS
jgi:hypothetical protein